MIHVRLGWSWGLGWGWSKVWFFLQKNWSFCNSKTFCQTFHRKINTEWVLFHWWISTEWDLNLGSLNLPLHRSLVQRRAVCSNCPANISVFVKRVEVLEGSYQWLRTSSAFLWKVNVCGKRSRYKIIFFSNISRYLPRNCTKVILGVAIWRGKESISVEFRKKHSKKHWMLYLI